MTTKTGTSIVSSDQPRKHGEIASHPKGLWTLANTELWERLSFYGLQVILGYYIYYSVTEGGLGLSQSQALGIIGAYGGGVYLTQPVGAWLADRVFAVRYVVLVSGCLIMAGHITIALIPQLTGLLLGLGLIALGTGALFPNVIAMLGKLYEDKPLKRDSGFSIFYTGIMLGALVGPIITGFLQVKFGFHVAFTAAAVGMSVGLIIYIFRWRTLPESAKSIPNPLTARGKVKMLAVLALAILAGIALTKLSIVTLDNLDTIILGTIAIVSIVYFVVMLKAKETSPEERHKVFAFIPIYLSAIIFWTMVLQLFTTFAVYADTRVSLSLGTLEIPAAYISTFQVIAGIIVGPFIAVGWQKLGERQPSTATKMAIGLFVMASAYAIFALIPTWYGNYVALLPVVLGMVVFGIAEVMFAPIVFSAATQLAPRAFYAQMVSLSGLVIGAGASLSGFVGQLYDPSYESVFFSVISLCILLAALVIFVMRSWLQRCGLE